MLLSEFAGYYETPAPVSAASEPLSTWRPQTTNISPGEELGGSAGCPVSPHPSTHTEEHTRTHAQGYGQVLSRWLSRLKVPAHTWQLLPLA